MQSIAIQKNKALAFLCLALFLFSGCEKKDPGPEEPIVVNELALELDGQSWQPTAIDGDKCRSRFNGAWSVHTVNDISSPAFTITAHSNSGKSDMQADDLLEIQITGVHKKGTYHTTGTYQEIFDSYAYYLITHADGTSTRYVNTPNSFQVRVDEILPLPGYVALQSIKGSFEGILFHEQNPEEFIRIERGSFKFNKPNSSNPNHCSL
ncbi:DUF5025 domain-containing protein [Pontibacter sp. BAB1700]|uniref:DUF5025 domain-containing protein n=1 Tax=Pontibacter sp. BAB1700 TaxID=1144253 RepID=UPI00026BDD40|nr:DUF5025 domain-containing protein [Pontibacter sp. BAB1700]EJF10825.1 hypothetical protein O71_06879 [Pontibacter sp. BAB1700]